MLVVESALGFPKGHTEKGFGYTVKLCKFPFRPAPKRSDFIDIDIFACKLIPLMVRFLVIVSTDSKDACRRTLSGRADIDTRSPVAQVTGDLFL